MAKINDRSKMVSLIYGVGRSSKKVFGYTDEPLVKTRHSKVLFYYCLKEGHNKKTCPMLKTWKDKKLLRTNKKDP